MKLNPKQAPVYGECVLTVHLRSRNKRRADVFYLLFTGSTQRHVASTQRVNATTLQTVAPAHGCCEVVTVSLCRSKNGAVVVLEEESFEFIHDEAFYSAQFLAANATNQQALNFARFLISAQPRPGDVTILDKKITLAFKHLQLPSEWNVLGETPLTDGQKQETLMHFAARLGFCYLSKFLLDHPGGRTALSISNNDGATPASLASERGFTELICLLSENNPQVTPYLSDPSHVEHFKDCWLRHNSELNVYILTREADTPSHIRMETLIEDLCRHIEGHSSCPGTCVKSEQEPESEEMTDICHQDVEKNVTDKTLDLHSDSDSTEKKFSTMCSEESCSSDKVEEVSVNIDSEVEALGGDHTLFSFGDTSTEPKEEEEGTKSIVESEDVSATHHHIQRFPTEVQGVESLLSSGNPNEHTGMTSTGIVLDHEGLCRRDNLDEEMITTTERATPGDALTEALDKTTVLTVAAGVDMGQAMPGYCTSAASSKDTVCNNENSEQEVGAVTLLPSNENQAIDSFNDSFCQRELNTCLLNKKEQCDIVGSAQPEECTTIKFLDCTETCDMKDSETSVSASQSKSLDQVVDENCLNAKEENTLGDAAECQPKMNGAEAGSMLENEPASSAQSTEDLVVPEAEAMAGAIDTQSITETGEQDTEEASPLPVDDNQTALKAVTIDQGEPSLSLIADTGQCDIVESLQFEDCTVDCPGTYNSEQTDTKGSDQCTDSTRLVAEGTNTSTDADIPVCSIHDCVGDGNDASAPCTQDTLHTETSSLVDCVKEEPGEVAKQAPVQCDRVEDSSEVLKVSRGCLHPIAEESLPSGDSSSDNAPTSSESEASDVPSASQKPAHGKEEDIGQGTMNQPSSTLDCAIERIAAALVCSVVDSTAKLCMKEMVNGGCGMPENNYTQSSNLQQSDLLQPNEDYKQDAGESFHVCKEDDSGLDLSVNMEETQCPSISDTEIVLEPVDRKAEDEVDFVKPNTFMINRENCCSLTPCPHMVLLDSKQTSDSKVCPEFLEEGPDTEHSSPQPLKSESTSDTDLCYMAPEVLDEMVFAKLEEEQSLCDVSSLGSDDNASLERNSSHGSDISIPPTLYIKKPRDRLSMDSSCSSTVAASVEERECENPGVSEVEGEEMDNISEVSPHITRSKSNIRSVSPPRRHSWEPWKHTPSDSEISRRSYSLEGLAGKAAVSHESSSVVSGNLAAPLAYEEEVRSGSSLSLTEEKTDSDHRKSTASHHEVPDREKIPSRGFVYSSSGFAPHLTKSMSLTTISNSLVESSQSLNIPRNSLAQSIPEESCDVLPLSPSQKDLDLKGGTKVSRTFSYLRHKMSGGKKTKEKEKDKDKTKEKDKEPKEKDKDKKTINGHVFSFLPVAGPFSCNHCTKNFSKDSYLCSSCNSVVHKGCREGFTPCAKVKMKQQKVLQPNDTSSLPVVMRNKGSQQKERPRSAVLAPEEATFSSLNFGNRRPQTTISISKSISTQNIAGVGCEDNIWGTWKVLSQSTDSLHKISKVNESMESLVDEGTDMNEGQLMGEFEADSKQLEAESWSQTVDSKFLKQFKKDVVKRQDVIYELMQTEMHHVRTLKIMNEVYCRGMLTELQIEQKVLERIFPCIDDLLNIHTQFFQRILDRKKESVAEKSEHNFVIEQIGDILVNQFSGEKAEHMKRTYGKFCGHHNEAVNHFKDLLSKEKRFQAFIKKKGSSSLVRRLGIPECILLVTQRITKYPVILQRILQYTKENETEHEDIEKALSLIKDIITEVNNKVNNYEKKKRLNEIYNKTDSKSIQRMKSGQMFAKEDLKRRKLVRDGNLFLRSSPANRIKEVLAVLLTDVLVFLQEKDQKYAFASLEQKSTVISLKKLIVRKVAHDEKGLFLISMGGKDPEMVEVLTNTKEERDSWIGTIQDTMTTMDKDEDEGVPSESEEEKKNWDTKARELRGQLHQKDEQIINLLEEKEKLFQALTLCSGQEENSPATQGRTLFRANTEEAPRGEPLIKSAIQEVETLEVLVNQYLWSSLVAQESGDLENGVGPVSLPRRAETFGGFDSHQLSASKCGEKDEAEDAQDLRRTESDSVLKKGVNPSVVVKRNGMQVLMSVSNLHKHLKSLQAVVVQQDTYIEDQKMMLTKGGALNRKSRPNSLNDQEKQRSLEKLRQEISSLEKQQAQHREQKLRNEWQWESREKKFSEWKEWSSRMDEDLMKSMQEMEQKKNRLEIMKAFSQCDVVEGLGEELRQGKTQEQRSKDPKQVSFQHEKISRVPSLPVSMDSKWGDSNSTKQEQLQSEVSTSPKKDSLLRTDSKQKGKGHFNLLGSQSHKSAEGHSSNRLFNLSKPKEKKDKKKKSKGASPVTSDPHPIEGTTEEEEIFC